MQALCALGAMILALVSVGQLETPKGITLVTAVSGHAPAARGGLPRLPPVPRLPRVPRLPKWP